MSVTQRTWLAFCLTVVLVTNSMCGARCARASLGTYALVALSWMGRHKMPWDHLRVARVWGILRHHGITAGRLGVADTDTPRAQSAQALALLEKRRAKASGGSLGGHSRVLLVLVPPQISRPVGVVF
jgi:hypothetical protein